MAFKFITAEEAAEFIHHNDNVGFSGFTAAGTPKVVSVALAKKAEAEHAAGRPFQIGVYTGASTSDYIDGAFKSGKKQSKAVRLINHTRTHAKRSTTTKSPISIYTCLTLRKPFVTDFSVK